jgi:glycosyltransferase involved in cell wall biosynthesis
MARVPFAHLPEYLSSSWVTLAPLVDNAFNHSKSAIKFLESAAFGAPCIATPIPDMLKHEAGGLQLARTENDWEQLLDGLLDESAHRNLRHKSRTWVEQQGMAHAGAEALAKAVTEWTQ